MKRYKVDVEVRTIWNVILDAEDEYDAADQARELDTVNLNGYVICETIENVGWIEEVISEESGDE